MTFAEWSKSKKEKSTEKLAAEDTENAAGVSDFARWSQEQKKKKEQNSPMNWAESSNALIKQIQDSVGGGWVDADTIQDYRRQAVDLASRTGTMRHKTAGYMSAQGSIDSVEEALASAQKYLDGMGEYYGQWDSKDAYDEYQEWYGVADPNSKNYDPDFEEKSKYTLMENEGFWDILWNGEYADETYEYINNQDGRRAEMEHDHDVYASDSIWNDGESAWEEANYDQMTEHEIAIYNYHYATGGKDTADKYLASIQEQLNYRAAGQTFQNIQGRPVLELLSGITTGLDQFASGFNNLFNTEDTYIPLSDEQILSGMVHEDLADVGPNLPDWMGGGSLGQAGYGTVTTLSNMAPSLAVGTVNPAAGAALMGASAAGNSYQEVLNEGYSKEQARAYGTLVGISEATLQYVLGGVGKLGGKVSGNLVSKTMSHVNNALLRTSMKLAGNVLSEGVEESTQELLTPLFKSMITGEEYQVQSEDVIYAGLMGAVTAGILESGGTVSGNVRLYNAGKALQAEGVTAQQLAEVGKGLSAESAAYQLAERVNENTGAYTMGRLYQEIGAQLTAENVADIQKSLERKGVRAKDAKILAEGFAAVAAGAQLTDTQISAIEANDILAQTVKDVLLNPKSTVSQRTAGFNTVQAALPTVQTTSGKFDRMVEKGFKTDKKKSTLTKAPETAVEGPVAVEKVSEDTGTSEVAKAPEAAPEAVSEAGVTRLKATGEPVQIQKVASVKDGKLTFQTADGTKVDGVDIEYSSDGEGLVYETVAKLAPNAAAANLMLGTYRGSDVQAVTFAKGMEEAFLYGSVGIPMEQALKRGSFISDLQAYQIRTGYQLGQMYGGKKTAMEHSAARRGKDAKTADTSKGQVHFDGDRSKLSKTQKASLDAIEVLAKSLGIQIHVFESEVDAEGRRIGDNGWYDPSDGSIHIDLYAGADGKGTMLFTVAHELTHFIRQWSPAKFKVLANFLMKQYSQQGISVQELVDGQIDKAKRNDRELTFEEAYEEMVADSLETMLVDGNVIQMMAELKQQDKSLWEKIRSWFKDLAGKLRAVVDAYKGAKPDSTEGRLVADMQDVIVILESLYQDALVDASENYHAGAQKNTTPESGGVKHQAKPSVKNPNVLDPRTITKMDVAEMLEGVKAGKYAENSYIPVRISTPGIVQERLFARDVPIIMPVSKVLQAFKEDGGAVKGKNIRGHGLSTNQLIDIIVRMDSPDYVYAQNNGRGVEVIRLNDKSDNTVVIVEFDNNVNPAYMNGYEGGMYNVSVTVFDIDGGNVGLFMYSQEKGWREVFNKQKEGDPAKKFPATRPFAIEQDSLNDNVSQSGNGVNRKLSSRDPEYQRVSEALEKENAKLKEDVTYLKELVKLQRTVTGGTKFTRTSVDAAAQYLKKMGNAKGDTREFAAILKPFYEYIATEKELSWEGVMEQAQPAVQWLQEHTQIKKERSEYAQDILKQLRGTRVYLDESQIAEAAYRFGSYNDFRKSLMGSITLAKDANTSLDSLWQELSSQYPNVFDSGTTSTDMPGKLADIIDSLKSSDISAMEHAQNREMIAQELLQLVYDSYWRVSTLHTVADVKQRKIDRLKGEHFQRMEKLKQHHREQVDQMKQEHRQRLDQVRQDYRDRANAKVKQLQQKYQESRSKGIESRKKTELRRKIRKTIRELNKLFSHGTKERNVKEGMKDLVADALAAAEVLFMESYTTNDMIRQGVGVELSEAESKLMNQAKDIMAQLDDPPAAVAADKLTEWYRQEQRLKDKLNKLKRELDGVFQRERQRLDGTTVSSLLGALSDAYSELKDSEDAYIRDAYDENVDQFLSQIRKGLGATRIMDMRLDQLEALHKAYTMVMTTVRNANKCFAKNLKESRQTMSANAMEEVKKAGGVHGKWSQGQLKRTRRSWNNEKPVYAMERIGSPTLMKLYNNLRGGEDVWATDVSEARNFFLQNAKKYGFNDWDFKKRFSFTSSAGVAFDLDLQQIMSLYAYSKREQALGHLMKGGFVFDASTEVVVEKGIRKSYIIDSATAYDLSMETLGEVVSKLTAEQKGFVDAMQDYLSTTMGEKGNEVSMALYGVKLFNEQSYFPLRSSGAYLSKAKVQEMQKEQGAVSIKNSGFTNATTPKASNPVILSGFMDVWANHVNDMSLYHGFVLPLEDFTKVYHYSTPHLEGEGSRSVNQAIIDAYSSAATDYVDQLLRDVNGGVLADPRESDYKAWISKFKKASVMASASVVIQQPSAIVRALAYIDPKYFGPLTISRGVGRALGNKVTGNHTSLYEELKKYAPVAAIKQMGYFDTNMGMTAVDFLTTKEYEGFKGSALGLLKDKQYRKRRVDDAMGFLASRADEITWVQIWQAVKKEVADKQKLTVGSEAHLKAAGERFTEVITKTQVYDSVFARSANMRSKGALMSMTTSFMAEPTTTANMITDAIRKAKKGDVKQLLRVGASVSCAVVFNNILRSLIYAMRDDDEDETFIEKYLQALGSGIVDDAVPLNYLPFWRDVWSLAQGYDAERADMSVIATAIEAGTDLAELLRKDTSEMSEEQLEAHNQKLADTGWKFVDGICSAVGLPEKNIRRDIMSIFNSFDTLSKDFGGRGTTANSLTDNVWEELLEGIPGVSIAVETDSKTDNLYDAIVSGDKVYVARLKAGYKSDSAYHQAIRKGLRENDMRIKQAAVARVGKDIEEYKRIATEIISEGNFVQDDVVLAIMAEVNAMEAGSGSTTSAKHKGIFTSDDLAVAVSQDDLELADEVKADIIETGKKNGKTEEKALESFVSAATSSCKEAYLLGELSDEQAVRALVAYCDKEEYDAWGDVAYWSYKQEDPDSEISAQWFDTYYKKVESSGLELDVYLEYREKRAAYSKKEDILKIIDSLPVGRKQKDALYFAEGWKESTLDDAPWR